jgi:hypothetical protein
VLPQGKSTPYSRQGVTLSLVATLSIALVVPLWICGDTIDFAYQIALFKIHYLIPLWVVVHACQFFDSENLIDHRGGLLVPIWSPGLIAMGAQIS